MNGVAQRIDMRVPLQWCEGSILTIVQQAIAEKWDAQRFLQRVHSQVIATETFDKAITMAQRMMVLAYQRAVTDLIEVQFTHLRIKLDDAFVLHADFPPERMGSNMPVHRIWNGTTDKVWE